MKLISVGLSALALGGCVLPGFPMMPTDLGGIGGTGMTEAEVEYASASLKSSQAAGMAAAARPGDEAMTCGALQAELITTMRDPAVTAAMGTMGARAQDQKSKLDAAQASGKQQQPTAEDSRSPLASSADISSIMPQLMRGQRLNDLAGAKNCAFLKGASPG